MDNEEIDSSPVSMLEIDGCLFYGLLGTFKPAAQSAFPTG